MFPGRRGRKSPWETRGAPGTLPVVSRVVITGNQPQHLSAAEAHAWLRSELMSLRALPGVESVVLTRVALGPWAWICELHLSDGAQARACAEHPTCTEWLLDLRLLGMRPALAVLETGERVS
jgi:hypothetical protein